MEKLNIISDSLLNFVDFLSIFRRVSKRFNFDFSLLSFEPTEKKKKYAKEKILKKKFYYLKKVSVILANPVLMKPSAEQQQNQRWWWRAADVLLHNCSSLQSLPSE